MALGSLLGGIGGSIAGSFLPIPGVGTALGGAVGSGLGGLYDYFSGGSNSSSGNWLTGTPAGVESVNPYMDWQQKLFQQLGSGGMNLLQNPYSGWDPIQQNAMDQFSQQIVPSLAERFTTMTNGNLSSPAFASQLGSAGAQLSSNLNAQREMFGQQNRQQGLQMLAQGLTPQQQFIPQQAQPGFLGGLLTAATPAAAKVGFEALSNKYGWNTPAAAAAK